MGHSHLESEWKSGLCNCSGPCFTACFCPCILIGKNAARLNNPSDTDPSCCNGTCVAYCFLEAVFGAGCILTCLQRKDVRDKYNIQGGGCGDFCVGCWCRCCALMQHAREIEEREVLLDKRGYQAQPGMHVPVPQQQQQYQQPVYVPQQNQTQQYPQQQHHHHQQHFDAPHIDVQHHQT